MSQYRVKPMMDPLERQARETQRYSQRMEERKPRILHAKTRIIGVDTQSLGQQTRERQERERIELERDMYYDAMSNGHARTLTEMESLRQKQVRQKNVEVNRFREQQEDDRRRNDMIKARIADNYKLEETNFLKFRGEDAGIHNRVKAQQNQQMDWLSHQVSNLQVREDDQRQYEADIARYNSQVHEALCQQEAEAARRRLALAKEGLRYNQQLAIQVAAGKDRERMKEEARSQAEVNATMNGDLLNERVLNSQRDGFKGFTPEQRSAVLAEQQRQVEALRQKRKDEAAWEKGWQDDAESVRREMVKKDRAKMAAATQRNVQYRKTQEDQAGEKQRVYDYLDNVVYTNPVKESYFQQWGQSAR